MESICAGNRTRKWKGVKQLKQVGKKPGQKVKREREKWRGKKTDEMTKARGSVNIKEKKKVGGPTQEVTVPHITEGGRLCGRVEELLLAGVSRIWNKKWKPAQRCRLGPLPHHILFSFTVSRPVAEARHETLSSLLIILHL